MRTYTIQLNSSDGTESVGEGLAKLIRPPATIYLEGHLGVGKTTFAKGLLRGWGFSGLVKSPTYTLIELYPIADHLIVHADLYRIKGSYELEEMGFREYFTEKTITVIEWASYAQDWLPKPTILCTLKMADDGKGRCLEMQATDEMIKKIEAIRK